MPKNDKQKRKPVRRGPSKPGSGGAARRDRIFAIVDEMESGKIERKARNFKRVD